MSASKKIKTVSSLLEMEQLTINVFALLSSHTLDGC
jgi:hypothetical protein